MKFIKIKNCILLLICISMSSVLCSYATTNDGENGFITKDKLDSTFIDLNGKMMTFSNNIKKFVEDVSIDVLKNIKEENVESPYPKYVVDNYDSSTESKMSLKNLLAIAKVEAGDVIRVLSDENNGKETTLYEVIKNEDDFEFEYLGKDGETFVSISKALRPLENNNNSSYRHIYCEYEFSKEWDTTNVDVIDKFETTNTGLQDRETYIQQYKKLFWDDEDVLLWFMNKFVPLYYKTCSYYNNYSMPWEIEFSNGYVIYIKNGNYLVSREKFEDLSNESLHIISFQMYCGLGIKQDDNGAVVEMFDDKNNNNFTGGYRDFFVPIEYIE